MLKKKKKEVAASKQPIQYDTLTIIDGTFKTTIPESYKRRVAWTRPDPRQVFSFIPGTITEICVTEGQSVKIGDKLLMFKAMKMNNTLAAAQDGVIGSIKVAIEEVVPKGVLLLEYK